MTAIACPVADTALWSAGLLIVGASGVGALGGLAHCAAAIAVRRTQATRRRDGFGQYKLQENDGSMRAE